MKTEQQIRERLTECVGDIKKLSSKRTPSSEEYDDLGARIVEHDTLLWVLS